MGSKDKNHKKYKQKPKREGGATAGGQDSGCRHGIKNVVTDSRFASVHSDPRFAKLTKHKSKVAIDSRFHRMFTDKSFSSSSAQIDKRGKPKDSSQNHLKHYYRLEEKEEEEKELKSIEEVKDEDADSEEESEESESEREVELKKRGGKPSELELKNESDESASEDDEDEDEDEDAANDDKSSTDTTDSDEEYDIFSEEENDLLPEENVPEIDKETHRLAVVNLDWSHVKKMLEVLGDFSLNRAWLTSSDSKMSSLISQIIAQHQNSIEQKRIGLRIFRMHASPLLAMHVNANLMLNHTNCFLQLQAVDLYVLLSSFLPKGGQILSVAVYPSEFGLKRMEEEAVHGPVALFNDSKEQNESDDDDGNDEISDKKLREYELSRLRYYYAVVECDSSATADYLYKTCDGIEFERSSNKLDLRFIPDSMQFKHPPRDVATEAPVNYEGADFHTRALQHSKINLTWDEDEPQRARTLKRKFNAEQLAELELKEFLASDESETDEDKNYDAVEDQSEKKHKKQDLYRSLLQSGKDSDEDDEEGEDMEVTFNTGLEDISKRMVEKKDKISETVWEAQLRKGREKKKARKNRSKYSTEDEGSDTDQEPKEETDDFFIEEPSVKGSEEGPGKSYLKVKKKHKETAKEAEASMAELELLLADDNGADTGLKGYNSQPKKTKGKKGKKGKEIPDERKIPTIDYDDPRFSALFTSPLYALDPTDPEFKRSAAYARQLVEKQRKGKRAVLKSKDQVKLPEPAQLPSDDPKTRKNGDLQSDELKSKKDKYELSSLIKSIKMKSKQLQIPSNSKTSGKK